MRVLLHHLRAGEAAIPEDSISAAKRIAEDLEKRPKAVPDGYFECCPDAAGFAGGLDDSDDDIDFTKMDMVSCEFIDPKNGVNLFGLQLPGSFCYSCEAKLSIAVILIFL